ncbi:MAG: tRNA (adenosine(37)-N6)-threonylcarbamoyltransferase complex dimerization subunit type 1 TsaB [Deltaproteobacteria bacterium]|nr:tRNA (adenosine(37)-N6)-threonylcarbamoyltransferase complex dimerization subunit type 1 TsaB [Deltaproteobacteria bacterium]
MSAPLLLAIETATRVCSVALARGGDVIALRENADARLHSERLLPLIDALLGGAGVKLGEVEAFAISIGPGSFTGLRIGLATLKAFALDDARPAAPVSTLAALCASAGEGEGAVAALLDARRGAYYAACVSRAGLARADVLADCVLTPPELAAKLPQRARVVVGEGARAGADALAALRPDLALLELPNAGASAASIARLAAQLLAEGAGRASSELAPAYLRRAEAEARRTGRAFEE